MNIGYVINSFYPVVGGTESYYFDLTNIIAKYHNVCVYTTNVKTGDNFRIIKTNSDTIHAKHQMLGKVELYRSKVTQIPFITAEKFIERYTRYYRETQSKQSTIMRQITVFLNWGFSFGICRHLLQDKLDIIHYTSLPLLHTYSDGFIARLRGIPSVFYPSFHRGSDHEAFMNRIPFQLATKVVVHGIDEKQDIQRLFRVPDEKIEIFPSPIDLKAYNIELPADFFPALSERSGVPKVLFIGRLTHNKGFIFLAETMIDLWKQGLDVDFIYIGVSTAESKFIEPLLQKYPNHAYHFQNIPHELKVQLLRLCDMVILPSIVESWGLVFLEGWSQKKPVIGAKGQCYGREFLKDNVNGFTVPFLNRQILEERIKNLIEDTGLRKKLGENGYRLLKEKFTMEAVFPRYLTLYEEISKR